MGPWDPKFTKLKSKSFLEVFQDQDESGMFYQIRRYNDKGLQIFRA